MCLQDSGNSVRNTDFVSGYPAGLHTGASWNKDLARARGYHMANEFRTKGVNVLLGPVVGPMGRILQGGRNWEAFSVDPYLSGALVGPTVEGMQSTGVITSTKHYIANEQETDRNPNGDGSRQAISSNIDDTTMHELYLWPFQEAVRAGSANIMCSYQRINNSYGCQNSKTLNGILKEELGFQGFVVSDWLAQHSGVASAYSGLDMAMPGSPYWGSNLVEAVKNGSLPSSRLDDMVTRIMASWYQLGQDSGFPTPGVGMAADLTAPHKVVNARKRESRSTLLQGAIEGHVLVKNTDNILPFDVKKLQMLSIFGYDAKAPDQYDNGGLITGWSLGINPYLVSQLLCGFTGGTDCPATPAITNQTLWTGGGSGASTPAYVSDPFSAIQEYAGIMHDIALFWDFLTPGSNANVDPASDACLVFINAFATEYFDRPALRDDFSDQLVNNIADKCNNTIVVVHNAGTRLVDQWIDHPNVKAVLFGHVPGQDSGRAIVKLLFGFESPSGKLPYTVAKNESDYGAVLKPAVGEGKYVNFPQDDFSEGVYLDYRAFDKKGIDPRFEFGFGLSYTTFSFSSLKTAVGGKTKRWAGGYGYGGKSPSLSTYPTGPIVSGGAKDLFDVVATVTATVKNTGSMTGAEVAQLYVGIPGNGQPVRQLRGFDKVTLKPGKSAQVTFELRRRDLSIWDVEAQKWKLQKGEYKIYVGSSSRKLPLKGSLTI